MSDCPGNTLTIIQEPLLQVEIEEAVNSFVEIDAGGLVVEVHETAACMIEVDTGSSGDLHVDVIPDQVLHTEITDEVLVVEFFDNITIIDQSTGGGSGESLTCEYVAASQIQVNRVVALLDDGRIEHADKDNPAHELAIQGVAKQSGAIGALVEVVTFGKLTGAAIGSINDDLWLGNNGQMTTIPPTSGTWIQIGEQIAATTFFVKMSEPIIRS